MSFARALIAFLFLGAAVLAQPPEYVISTFAGGAPPPTPILGADMPLGSVESIATDAMGNAYFVASHCVFKLDQNGVVTRIAGNGRAGYSGDGGPATSAQLRLESIKFAPWDNWVSQGMLPPGIAVDNGGNVYVADNGNYRIRRISPDGIITTVMGSGTPGFSGDGGLATNAQLSPVYGLAIDVAGNLLIADSGANRVRRVTSDGTIATVAGTGDCGSSGDGGPAVAAAICGPAGIAVDIAGNLFITDLTNGRIRQVAPDGTITTVAGTGPSFKANPGCAPSGDGGPATSAVLCLPINVAVDGAGDLFVIDTYPNADYDNCCEYQVVRKISPNGMIASVAGSNCLLDDLCYKAPGYGTTAVETLFLGPLGLAVDYAGNLLIAGAATLLDVSDFPPSPHIYKVSTEGAIAAVAGNGHNPFSGDGGPATSAQLASPYGVAVDSGGNVLIADIGNNRIRRVTPDGTITTAAGNGNGASSGDGGLATSAQVVPLGITVDGAGSIFFFDAPNRSIRKISRDGMINTVITVGGNDYFVALDRASDLFIADPKDTFGAIAEVSPDGTIRRVAGGGPGSGGYYGATGFLGDGGPATSAGLMGPQGVAVDADGNIFIADTYHHRIRKVTPDGIITTVAGSGPPSAYPGDNQGGFAGDGGPAIDAQLKFPLDVVVDGAGNLYIADWGNNRIRRVAPDGIITTVAGNGIQGYSGDGGLSIRASISSPNALAVDGSGNIYVADSANNAIRILQPVATPAPSAAGLNQPSIRR
jgi:sugar lactone lactonase YvrE